MPTLIIKHGDEQTKTLAFLEKLVWLMEVIGSEVCGEFEGEAGNGSLNAILRIG